ncbi:hypothetical protein Tco_0467593 [Tanacetum coccineum]
MSETHLAMMMRCSMYSCYRWIFMELVVVKGISSRMYGDGVFSFGWSSLKESRLTKFECLTLILAVFLLKFGELVLEELVIVMSVELAQDFSQVHQDPKHQSKDKCLDWETNIADKAASTGVDVRHGGATTTVTSLDAGHGSGNIVKPHPCPMIHLSQEFFILGNDEGRMQHNELMDLVTKLSDRVVKKLEKTVKTRQAKRKARIVVFNDEEDLENPSKQGRKIDEIDQDPDISLVQHDAELILLRPVSTAGASVSTAGASSAKDKGKAIMEEAETIQTKTKLQLEQERLGYEEALRLQAKIDEEERQRIARVQEEASFFSP